MADKKVAIVVKIEYEIDDNRDRIWIAYIMAYSQDEAIKYLAKFLKKTIKVTAVGLEAPRIDAISDEVRESIAGKKKIKGPNKEKKNKKADIEPKKEDLENLKNIKDIKAAREIALEDLKKQEDSKKKKTVSKPRPKPLNMKKK